MRIPIYQVNAFTRHPFRGNPAAVCPLEEWLPDNLLQKIAWENNLSETAFFVQKEDSCELRWFTPTTEVDLCGHATLATAFVLFHFYPNQRGRQVFQTRSGELITHQEEEWISLLFPASPPQPCSPPPHLLEAFREKPLEILKAKEYLVLFSSQEIIGNLKPDLELLKKLDTHGVIVTAPGEEVDFVSRFFAPQIGIPEDPVTGSAHCTLIPYWALKLKKKDLQAQQLSPRGGDLRCLHLEEQVKILGEATLYLEGSIHL